MARHTHMGRLKSLHRRAFVSSYQVSGGQSEVEDPDSQKEKGSEAAEVTANSEEDKKE